MRALVALLMMVASAGVPAAQEGRFEVVTFDQYTPLASNLTLAERLLTPLTAAQLRHRLDTGEAALSDQPIDLAQEQFRIYVPGTKPDAGYGLFVFIPPWEDNQAPRGWTTAFEAQGVIFVSAARSGNAESPLGRRAPLAILAAYNVMRKFPVDAARVYIAGFSGGSRVALRVALGYPDLFHGAFLDAGSDPVGESDLSFPPRALFEQFRATSRLVYVAGARDEFHLTQQASSVGSMHHWCVANVSSEDIGGVGHQPAPASVVSSALRVLREPAAAPSPRAARCWARLTAEIDAQLSQAEAEMGRGDIGAARSLLKHIDARFSGLAAPGSLTLEAKLRGGGASH